MKIAAVVELYKEEEVSISKAAELAGLKKRDFYKFSEDDKKELFSYFK